MRPSPDPVQPGQESVWDYPRPPALVASSELVKVWFGGELIAETQSSLRILETSHAPAYYLPTADITPGVVRPNENTSWCEYKGMARYGDLVVGEHLSRSACWWYPEPAAGYEELLNTISFYPQRVSACEVDGETVLPLQSAFYGDWPTSRIAGPYKGAPGTEGW